VALTRLFQLALVARSLLELGGGADWAAGT